MKQQPEHCLQAWVSRFLDVVVCEPRYITGIDHPFVINAGANARHQQKLLARGVRPGTPDVWVCQAPGRTLWLELKWGKNKPSDAQKGFAEAMWRCNVPHAFCYSLQDVLNALHKAGFCVYPRADQVCDEMQARVEESIAAEKLKKATVARKFAPAPRQKTLAQKRRAWATYAKLLVDGQ